MHRSPPVQSPGVDIRVRTNQQVANNLRRVARCRNVKRRFARAVARIDIRVRMNQQVANNLRRVVRRRDVKRRLPRVVARVDIRVPADDQQPDHLRRVAPRGGVEHSLAGVRSRVHQQFGDFHPVFPHRKPQRKPPVVVAQVDHRAQHNQPPDMRRVPRFRRHNQRRFAVRANRRVRVRKLQPHVRRQPPDFRRGLVRHHDLRRRGPAARPASGQRKNPSRRKKQDGGAFNGIPHSEPLSPAGRR